MKLCKTLNKITVHKVYVLFSSLTVGHLNTDILFNMSHLNWSEVDGPVDPGFSFFIWWIIENQIRGSPWLKMFVTLISNSICKSDQKSEFSVKCFFRKCEQIYIVMGIWSLFLKKPLMEKFLCSINLKYWKWFIRTNWSIRN